MPHYFEPELPASPSELREFAAPLWGAAAGTVNLVSAPGVFSAGRLDTGTAVLLRTERRVAPPPPTGHFLDLGCGWGPLALNLARSAPQATVWAVDTNPRALALTDLNAHRLGLDNIRTALPRAVPPDTEFGLLWSNPPIRVGKEPLHQMLRQWLARLAPGAHADLVVQKNLGADSLERWLDTGQAWTAQKLASAKGYRVIRVSAPVASS
ncbi:MAG: methyltransferase [Bifidobacteriaceae bacterium]|nr:methyltransferase [Bifidobacteriaceae bacterium]